LTNNLISFDSPSRKNQTKRALVTGAAGEIGIALVQEFQRQGLQVFGTDIEPKPDRLELDRYAQLDLEKLLTTSSDERRELLSEVFTWTEMSGLDVLVNNAAIQVLAPAEELDVDSWQKSLNINLLAPFFLVQNFLPSLEKVGGSVVNVSSVHARLTKPGYITYATTKAALSGMTRAMAVELGNRIRVNAVEPASIDTPMLRASFEGNEKSFGDLAGRHPQGRIGTPEEIASLVYSIAMGEFKFLHGACVDVSGGISSRLHDVF
jgi:NAD(P)-dependent dehydrogenase (short-subunit alcohol dehydrogenase family)